MKTHSEFAAELIDKTRKHPENFLFKDLLMAGVLAQLVELNAQLWNINNNLDNIGRR